MSTSRVTTNASDFEALDPNSYTAHRLKHALPEHIYVTSHRFFIGPVPEGWLNSHRKEWYRRRLQLNTYSSRRASFRAATEQDRRHRTLSGLEGPSTAARMTFGFPQPENVFEQDSSAGYADDVEQDDWEPPVQTRELAPVATVDVSGNLSRTLGTPVGRDLSPDDSSDTIRPGPSTMQIAKSPNPESDQVADENPFADPTDQQPSEHNDDHTGQKFSRKFLQPSTSTGNDLETGSSTALLSADRRSPEASAKSLQRHEPAPLSEVQDYRLGRVSTGVRFKVSEGVQRGQQKVVNKAFRVQEHVANRRLRRNTLQEGTVVKMERMLVRVEMTLQQVPEEFDENESFKIGTRLLDKWREFIVVVRKSKAQDVDDYRLQVYKTRVIPEIDNGSTKKKPRHEIRLDPKTTKVNLYSSLDKTVVIWHPYKKGTRIMVVRPRSQGHSVEWYTFLRDILGWERPFSLEVIVPDLDVTVRLERPFEELEIAATDAADEETALVRTVAAEKAVAGRIISESISMLELDGEWSQVLKEWSETVQMGLAWKRYDRLEWVHGINEQHMYGSMAMARSHDLELRPKLHYATSTYDRRDKVYDEPPPVEGFLIRLTSQKGVHTKLGKAFFKRLFFSSQNQFLMFNRPAKATPPHPPQLATTSGGGVPSSHEIVEHSPLMYDIEPYKLDNGKISWLSSGNPATLQSHDRAAIEEARRNVTNILEADGYIHMCNIQHVRTMKRGATLADEVLGSGSSSDVDFHQEVADSRREDGSTQEIDDDRIFELVLQNGLVVRLQAYSKDTRDEWIRRLRELVRYWKLRTAAEMRTFKAVRQANLEQLSVDEEMEAIIGQFAKKWEVSRSQASPELYNMCAISSCRSITMSGSVFLKTRRRATFHRCQVILTGGQMLIFQSAVRKRTGQPIKFVHQEKQQAVDLKDCYVYSGLIVGEELLYENRTFDANHPGLASLPRVYLEDGWTSADVDIMTCFVVWQNRKKSWFRTATAAENAAPGPSRSGGGRTRATLRRVGQLGVLGRPMVFKCRSRAERDHWVLNIASEIERVIEHEVEEHGEEGEFRFENE
ncbi:hypothetical protein AYL99_09781 [Fonsecaea erecta]|uniref:PH domain-containing protein n=1 Tax=Fonsecaea erecta TaxID=1367422 RepID=A0A178Z776_9EURO|nr:hypothetical protein AYL99_09781 [Fonsecaea erecta]OAP55629.1 hypothetical protein AYL99_09781 [Fonsecaea erecta]